ncbi:MAG: POTRA domain-containing protein, partial [Myxococcota bacterium]
MRLRRWAGAIAILSMLVWTATTARAQPAPPTPPGTGAGALSPIELPPLPPTEAEKARGKKIVEVRIVGNKRISKEEIEDLLQWLRKGKRFNPRGLSRDVRELWDQKYFDDIEVDLNQNGDEVRLRILVQERPSIREFKFEGNRELDDDDLEEIVKKEIKKGAIINQPALRRSVQRIRDKYAEEGYFLAEARFKVEPKKDNEVVVTFTIEEQEKVTVRNVTFIGNHSVPDGELRDLMLTGQLAFFSFGSGGPFRQDAFERDILVISSHYYDKGFLSVQIA